MKTKPKKHIIRALMLSLCLCLLCLPLMGMAMSGTADAVSDSGEPEIVVIDIMPEEETAALYSWNRPGHGGGGHQDDPCDPKPPVCICETKCNGDEANVDCPVCSVSDDIHEDCTGTEPEPAPVCICETKCGADTPNAACPVCSADVGGCTGIVPTPAPICSCETKCQSGAPNSACPVCSVDVTGCTGTEPTPAPVCICETKCGADAPNSACPVCSADVGGCTGIVPTLTPVCNCETKCQSDAPNSACPVCSADVNGCTGEVPDPDFTIRIVRPDGWYTETASVVIRVLDENKTGWKKVEVKIEKNGAWTDLTDELEEHEKAEVEISENCTLYVTVTDKDGKAHTKSAYVECFDRESPTVRAGIDGALLRVEASDALSGVEYIYINGYRFTSLTNGTLDVRLKDYADEYEQMTVVAVDYAGNKSKTVQVKNPYYGQDNDEPTTPTPTPIPTPTPTIKPNSSGGGQSVTPSATVTPTAPPDTTTPVTIEPGTGFSENGNAVTRDLLYDKYTNKQFIVVQDRDGNTFYMVIDYDKPLDEEGNQYETYFLNLVDVADMMALTEDGDKEAVCTCTDKCVVGSIDTSCPVCTANMSECSGKAAVTDTTPEPDVITPDEPDEESGGSPLLIILVLLLLAGGGALYYFKLRKNKPQTKGPANLDDYDYGEDEDDEEMEFETEEDTDDEPAQTEDGEA